MATLTYSRPNRLDALQDQLWAAGIRPERVTGLGDAITIVVPDGTDEGAVARIVAAHNPTALDAATQQQAQQQTTTRAAIIATAQGAVGKPLAALTATERNALLAVLLWGAGALTPALTVAPLDRWAAGPVRG